MRIYVAGEYSGSDVIAVLRNMRMGIRTCVSLLKKGHSPFCPWLDFQYGLVTEIDLYHYQRNSSEWLEVADAILMLPNWKASKGAQAELQKAEKLGKLVYFDEEAVPDAY